MRHREDYVQSSSLLFTSRPSLPRLKNKSSLGRLSAYGGVLDFEVRSSQVTVVPATPSFYRGGTATSTISLAGPVHNSGQDHNNNTFMHEHRSKQQYQDEQQHTPPKNTTQATLRALKMLNREKIHTINYDTASSTLPDGSIPISVSDHPHHLLQTGAADQTGITIHSQSRLDCPTSTLPTATSSSSHSIALQPASDVKCSSSSSSLGGVGSASVEEGQQHSGGEAAKKGGGETKDKDRLVRDMDDGGYASLEQVRRSLSYHNLSCFQLGLRL